MMRRTVAPRRKGVLSIIIAALSVTTGPPAGAEISVLNITPVTFARKWDDFPWRAWALPSGPCLTFYQGAARTSLSFWGFRQSPESSVEMIVGKADPISTTTVEVSLNDGEIFRKAATVERFGDYDGYVMSFQADALSIFPNKLIVDVSVGGNQFTYAVSTQMRNLEKVMSKCLAWQAAH